MGRVVVDVGAFTVLALLCAASWLAYQCGYRQGVDDTRAKRVTPITAAKRKQAPRG